MEEYESPVHKIVVSDGELKQLFVDYVGNKLNPFKIVTGKHILP